MGAKQIYYYSKEREVKDPVRGTSKSAGIDFFIPKFTIEFLKDLRTKNPNISELRPGSYSYYILDDKILLAPGERILIPCGIKLKGHENTAFIAHNKSGIGSKKGLDRLAEVVDEDYEGEIHINIVNTSNYIVEICEDEKIIQWLEIGVGLSELRKLNSNELFNNSTSERKDGGFGHTDKK